MEHLFVRYELSVKLKEKGFDEDCLYYYFPNENIKIKKKCTLRPKDYSCDLDGTTIEYGYKSGLYQLTIPAPLYQQIVDWFRNKHNIFIKIDVCEVGVIYSWVKQQNIDGCKIKFDSKMYSDYYECFDEAIKEALKLI